MQRIFLVGMMGSGKSTHGRYLAERLGWWFYDLDVELERRLGCSIAHFFNKYGEAAFREEERRELLRCCNLAGPFVLATGGGTPCFFENMALMNASGTTIYMNVPLPELERRLLLESREKRPLLARELSLAAVLERLFMQRRAWYEQARVECVP
jgi:shikimate kinase